MYACISKKFTIHHLLNHISTYVKLSTQAGEALGKCLNQAAFAKNDFIVKEGQVCRYMYFVQHGALRGFYNVDGKEVTHWFAFENDFVTSFHSFITQQPAVENIQVMEGSILWSISANHLTQLMNEHHDVERMVRMAYEKYYLRLEERFVNAQFKTATQLYQNLLMQAPHILERAPLGYIASYLGISQETLSRIRSKHI